MSDACIKNCDQAEKTVNSITILDDEAGVCFALKLLLETLGAKVEFYTKPQEAIAHLNSGGLCDLLLCDLRMPGMNGFEVLKSLEATRPDVFGVIMSAHAMEEDLAKGAILLSKPVPFLSKPFSPEELQDLLKQFALKLSSREPTFPPRIM